MIAAVLHVSQLGSMSASSKDGRGSVPESQTVRQSKLLEFFCGHLQRALADVACHRTGSKTKEPAEKTDLSRCTFVVVLCESACCLVVGKPRQCRRAVRSAA